MNPTNPTDIEVKKSNAGGTGAYYGPFGAPFLVPLDREWWPFKRKDRIAISTKIANELGWNSQEYQIPEYNRNIRVATTVPQLLEPMPLISGISDIRELVDNKYVVNTKNIVRICQNGVNQFKLDLNKFPQKIDDLIIFSSNCIAGYVNSVFIS